MEDIRRDCGFCGVDTTGKSGLYEFRDAHGNGIALVGTCCYAKVQRLLNKVLARYGYIPGVCSPSGSPVIHSIQELKTLAKGGVTMFESFKDTCPKCGRDTIKVIKVTLVATGETILMNSTLHKDGFEVDAPEDLEDQSTEDEKCRCETCGHEFDLAEVTL